MLPSFYISAEKARAWSPTRAAAIGAGIGAVAALFKTLAPFHETFAGKAAAGENLIANVPEMAAAAAGFALLCAAAAVLRNALARRLIWPALE